MKPNSQVDACNTSNDVLCTTSLSDASRLVAWVSGASATVWGVLLFGLVGSGSNFNSSGISLFLFYVTVLHTGQAIASAISFKLGALFAALAFVFAAIVVIENFEFAALLTTPLICSACAIVIARRHGSSPHCESVR